MVGIGRNPFPTQNRYQIVGGPAGGAQEPATETRDAKGITLKAGAGADQINVSNLGNGVYGVRVNDRDFRYNRDELARLTIDAGDGDNSITVDPSVDVPFRLRAGNGRDAIVNGANGTDIDAGGGDDFILNSASGAKINGNAGNDALISRGQQNLLAGGDGNDELQSLGHQNTFRGEGGKDLLRSLGARNTVHGGPGDDRVFARGRENYLRGGWGNDAIHARGAFNTLDGGPNNDLVRALGAHNLALGGMNGGWDNVGVLGYGNIKDAFHGLEDLQKLGLSGERPGLAPNAPPSFDSRGLFMDVYNRLAGLTTQSLGPNAWLYDLVAKLTGGVIR